MIQFVLGEWPPLTERADRNRDGASHAPAARCRRLRHRHRRRLGRPPWCPERRRSDEGRERSAKNSPAGGAGAADRSGAARRPRRSPLAVAGRTAFRRRGAAHARIPRLQGRAHARRTGWTGVRGRNETTGRIGRMGRMGRKYRLQIPPLQPFLPLLPYRAQVRCRPPSIGIVSPVIQLARSDARNRIVSATSSGRPGRPSGCVVFARSRNAAYCVSSMPERR